MSSLENEKNEKNGLPEVAVASALPFTSAPPPLSSIRNGKHVAFSPASSELDHDHDHDHDYPNPSHAPTVTATAFSPGPSRIPSPEPAEQHKTVESSRDASQSASITPATKWTCIKPTLLSFLKGLLHPASSSVIFSLIIAFTPPLKALFAPSTYHLSPGPDGLPPLSVLIDTANFIGAASVPLGLICLGGALARLPVPRGREAWRKLPSGAILALAVGKELVLPVLSVLICEGLTSVGVIPKDDKVLRYVCM
jgi:predicted permease